MDGNDSVQDTRISVTAHSLIWRRSEAHAIMIYTLPSCLLSFVHLHTPVPLAYSLSSALQKAARSSTYTELLSPSKCF